MTINFYDYSLINDYWNDMTSSTQKYATKTTYFSFHFNLVRSLAHILFLCAVRCFWLLPSAQLLLCPRIALLFMIRKTFFPILNFQLRKTNMKLFFPHFPRHGAVCLLFVRKLLLIKRRGEARHCLSKRQYFGVEHQGRGNKFSNILLRAFNAFV